MASEKVKSKEILDSSDDSEIESGSKRVKSSAKVESKSKRSKRDLSSDEEDASGGPWELSAKRFVNINSFRGKQMVDIREYYTDDSGETKPGKKGISLSLDQWEKLKKIIPEVDKKLGVK